MDTTLDKNQSELGVLVLFVSLQVLSDSDGLLDQHVQILRDGRSQTRLLQDTKDLVSGHTLNLSDSVGITEDDTDLMIKEFPIKFLSEAPNP